MFDAKSALHDMAHQIHICRTDERLTLQRLAQRSGVAASTIHKIEAQQRVPTISVLFKIARGLGRRPAELIRDQHEDRTSETSSRSTLSYEFEETEPKSNVGVWHIELAAATRSASRRESADLPVPGSPAKMKSVAMVAFTDRGRCDDRLLGIRR
jgi:transcriptional regulator with XRE-family HTH domain